jgi:methylated-DNA-[protein]-cysteine S-methyltransferase
MEYSMTRHAVIPSPVGNLTLVAQGEILTGLYFPGHDPAPNQAFGPTDADALLRQTETELNEYFARERQVFTVPRRGQGTPFQQQVWAELEKIPYGTVISYAELAKRVGSPGGSRAVGGANGRNPISIIVPCHRVTQSDGSLGGFGGGLPTKRLLLELEGTMPPTLPL